MDNTLDFAVEVSFNERFVKEVLSPKADLVLQVTEDIFEGVTFLFSTLDSESVGKLLASIIITAAHKVEQDEV